MTSEGRSPSPEDESLWGWKDGRPTFDGADLCPCSKPAWSHTAAAHDQSRRVPSRLPSGEWRCIIDGRTEPCGECGGCREVQDENAASGRVQADHYEVYDSIDMLDSMSVEPTCACGNDWPCDLSGRVLRGAGRSQGDVSQMAEIKAVEWTALGYERQPPDSLGHSVYPSTRLVHDIAWWRPTTLWGAEAAAQWVCGNQCHQAKRVTEVPDNMQMCRACLKRRKP